MPGMRRSASGPPAGGAGAGRDEIYSGPSTHASIPSPAMGSFADRGGWWVAAQGLLLVAAASSWALWGEGGGVVAVAAGLALAAAGAGVARRGRGARRRAL